MRYYTVHEPPVQPGDIAADAERLVFVKDGFSYPAFFFTPFWLVAKRAWWGLLAYIAIMAIVVAAVWATGVSSDALRLLTMIVALGFGLEGNGLWRGVLDRRGYSEVGTVAGKAFDECEQRFLSEWNARQKLVRAPAGGW